MAEGMDVDGAGGEARAAEEVERPGLREARQIRSLRCEHGPLSQADGSARWTQGQTSVLAAVFGPNGKANAHARKAILSVCFKAAGHDKGPQELEYEALLRSTMESVVDVHEHPRTVISIILQVLHDDGGVLPCAFNAGCTALVDAGIPMRHMFASVACVKAKGGAILVDPTLSEEKESTAIVCATFGSRHKPPEKGSAAEACLDPDPLDWESWGRLGAEELFQVMQVCKRGCQVVANFSHASLQNSFQNIQ